MKPGSPAGPVSPASPSSPGGPSGPSGPGGPGGPKYTACVIIYIINYQSKLLSLYFFISELIVGV